MAASDVTALSVVVLLAQDAGRTAAFYRDLLGIPLKGEQHDGRHTHYASVFGSFYFTIQPDEDFSTPPPGGYDFLQLCFSVQDLDAFLVKAKTMGIAPLAPPQPFEHTTYVTILDPDTRHVRVMTPWGSN